MSGAIALGSEAGALGSVVAGSATAGAAAAGVAAGGGVAVTPKFEGCSPTEASTTPGSCPTAVAAAVKSIGVPTVLTITGAFAAAAAAGEVAERAAGKIEAVFFEEGAGTCGEYVFVTTGTRCRTTLCGAVLAAGTEDADCRAGASGATRCTVGTRISGKPAAGSVSAGSDFAGAVVAGWRSAAASGPT